MIRLGGTLLLALAAGAATAKSITLDHAGAKRSCRLFVPERLASGVKPPLLLILHGGGGTGRGIERHVGTSINGFAGRDGWLVAYPDALHRHWNDGRDDTTSRSHREHVDDVGFIRVLIDRLVVEYDADPGRVFVAGISNGGMMACRLACECSDRITAIGVVASSFPKALVGTCRPVRPVSAIFLCGTADPLVPYAGGFVKAGRKTRGEVIGVREAVDLFARLAACTGRPGAPEPLPDLNTEDGCRVTRETWDRGAGGARVVLYEIAGGGHTWPGGRAYLPKFLVGPVCRDLDGSAILRDFFTTTRTPPRPGS